MSSGSSSCRSRLGATNSSYTNSGGSVAMVLNSRMRLSRTSAVMEHCQGAPDRLSDMYDTYEESTSQKVYNIHLYIFISIKKVVNL